MQRPTFWNAGMHPYQAFAERAALTPKNEQQNLPLFTIGAWCIQFNVPLLLLFSPTKTQSHRCYTNKVQITRSHIHASIELDRQSYTVVCHHGALCCNTHV